MYQKMQDYKLYKLTDRRELQPIVFSHSYDFKHQKHQEHQQL